MNWDNLAIFSEGYNFTFYHPASESKVYSHSHTILLKTFQATKLVYMKQACKLAYFLAIIDFFNSMMRYYYSVSSFLVFLKQFIKRIGCTQKVVKLKIFNFHKEVKFKKYILSPHTIQCLSFIYFRFHPKCYLILNDPRSMEYALVIGNPRVYLREVS